MTFEICLLTFSVYIGSAIYSAGILDVVQVFALDYSDGFTDPVLGAVAIAAFATEVSLFSVALRRIESAVAYGFYGLGTAAVAAISIGWLGEPLTATKGVALVAVIVGAVLLNMDGGTKPPVPDRATGDDEPESARALSIRSS